MSAPPSSPLEIAIVVAPHFNASATTAFIDPFRAANYLSGATRFTWRLVSQTGGMVETSSGLRIETDALASVSQASPWLAVISTSWAPEIHLTNSLRTTLGRWSQRGALIGGLDTGAILLANAGLLTGKTATVHYEHIDAFIELAPDTQVSEAMFTIDGPIFTCCGGTAATDVALHLLRSVVGESLANATARYLFHHQVRGPDHTQNPKDAEPMGYVTPKAVRAAIDLMEANLEAPISIPQIARSLSMSQRQLGRLFQNYVQKSPVAYYRDIRLDRARGLVTQTELKLSEVATAAGFNSQVHFSRAYTARFGLAPSQDRIQGRVPFEFRAWPMFRPEIKSAEAEAPPASR